MFSRCLREEYKICKLPSITNVYSSGIEFATLLNARDKQNDRQDQSGQTNNQRIAGSYVILKRIAYHRPAPSACGTREIIGG